jgi:hypothetical protein
VHHGHVRARADRHQPAVDEGAARRALLHVAEPAVERDALVGDGAHGAAAEELGHADVERGVVARDALADAGIGEIARGAELGQQLDPLELRDLHLGQRLPEQHALLAPALGLLPEVERRCHGVHDRAAPATDHTRPHAAA